VRYVRAEGKITLKRSKMTFASQTVGRVVTGLLTIDLSMTSP